MRPSCSGHCSVNTKATRNERKTVNRVRSVPRTRDALLSPQKHQKRVFDNIRPTSLRWFPSFETTKKDNGNNTRIRRYIHFLVFKPFPPEYNALNTPLPFYYFMPRLPRLKQSQHSPFGAAAHSSNSPLPHSGVFSESLGGNNPLKFVRSYYIFCTQ